jgi:hypothetical protein
MKVNNINGTSQNACPCGSWLMHWQRVVRSAIARCSVLGCSNVAEVGAHVQKDGATDRRWFIVPLCKAHNAKAASLTIRDDITLVPANVAQTCGASKQ